MGNTPERFWNRIAPHLRQHLSLHRPTLDEAQAAFDAAEDEPLSDEELDGIIAFAKEGRSPSVKPKRRKKWLEGLNISLTQNEMIPALNRNAGNIKQPVSDLMNELRQEVLKEHDRENEEETSIPSKEEEGE